MIILNLSLKFYIKVNDSIGVLIIYTYYKLF